MSIRDELREAADGIQRGIDAFRRDFETSPQHEQGLTVHDMRDMSGRPVLADLYAAKANIIIALSQLPREYRVDWPGATETP